jgi:WD40 repeat protein
VAEYQTITLWNATISTKNESEKTPFFDGVSLNKIATFKLNARRSPGSLAFSPDGRLLAAGLDNRTQILLDLAQQKTIATFYSDGTSIPLVAFSPDGKRLAMASWASARWQDRVWTSESASVVIWPMAVGR